MSLILLAVQSQLTQRPFHRHLLVDAQYALVHLLFTLTDLLVPAHRCKCDFEKPLLPDRAFDLALQRL